MPCKRDVTELQAEVLQYIKQYIAENGYPPTLREISSWFGWSSVNAAADVLIRLERHGKLKLLPGRHRGMRVLP